MRCSRLRRSSPPRLRPSRKFAAAWKANSKTSGLPRCSRRRRQELSDRAKAEHDLKKAAKEAGATIKTSDLVPPDGQVPDIGSMAGPAAVAFTMKPGDISGPISNGNTGVVLSILDRQEPSQQDYEAKKDQIRDAVLQTKQQEMFGFFLTNLRAQMEKSGKIKINQDEMKKLTRAAGDRNRESKARAAPASICW